jgi:hypothetical protein
MLPHLPTISLIGTHYKQELPSANIDKKQHTLTATPRHPLDYARDKPGACSVHAYNPHTHTQRLAMQSSGLLTQTSHISLNSAFGAFAAKGTQKGFDHTVTQAHHIQKYSYTDQPVCSLSAVCRAFIAYGPGGFAPGAFHSALGNVSDFQITYGAANASGMNISI